MDKRSAIEALLAQESGQPPQEAQPPGKLEALARGGGQGATLGFGDEAGAAVGAALQKVLPESLGGIDYGKSYADLYRENRDVFRRENEAARKEHPFAYGAGEVAGSLPLMAATGAGGSVGGAALQGGVQGAGLSGADVTRGDVKGLARDASLGAGLGVGAYGAGALFKGAMARVAAGAGQRAGAAAAKAGQAATEDVGSEVQSLVSKYGGLRQTENKAILNLLAREASGLLDETNQKALAALKSTGRVTEALNESATNDLAFLATRLPEVQAAKQAMQTAQAGAPQAIAERTAEMLSPAMAKQQILARALRYGPPAVGSAVGAAIGGPAGVAVGSLAGAGTRPMVQAVRRMVQNPAVQYQTMSAIERAAAPGVGTQFLRSALTAGAPAVGADYAKAALAPQRTKDQTTKAAAIEQLLSEETNR